MAVHFDDFYKTVLDGGLYGCDLPVLLVLLLQELQELRHGLLHVFVEGNMAMLLAAKKWEPEKEPHFVRYASYGVRKAMMAAIPQQGPMVTMPKNGMTDQRQMKRFSTDAPVHPGQTNTLGDMLKAGKPMTDDGAEISETNYAITLAFDQLNERERQIMTHFYGIGTTDQMTMAEIGERMNLKRERVRQIRKTAERKMRRIMKKQ